MRKTRNLGADRATLDRATAALLEAANAGNLRAIALIANGALARLDADGGSVRDQVAPHIAEASIAAGLVADQLGPERTAAWLRTFPPVGPDHPLDGRPWPLPVPWQPAADG